MKISYILSTAKEREAAEYQIKIIKSLPNHDHEIVLTSPDSQFSKNPNIRFFLDDKRIGGVYGYNLAYSHAVGDLIVLVPDDHPLPPNFLNVLDELETPAVKNQKLRIGTLSWGFGGPGLPSWDKKTKKYVKDGIWELHTIFPPGFPNRKPYYIACFPIIFKKDIDKYLDGKIFNECFHQSYSDNWLGFYADKINNGYPIRWPQVWIEGKPKFCDLPNSTPYKSAEWHHKDHITFLRLAELIHLPIRYNNIVLHE
jgi:hypothetical protein